MNESKILNLTHAVASERRSCFVHVCLFEVQKCNFNDQFLICDHWIPLCDVDGAPLHFFDPFFGKSKGDPQEVAIAYVDRESFWVQNKTKDGVTARECEIYCDHVYTTPFTDTTFLAAHISITTKKW